LPQRSSYVVLHMLRLSASACDATLNLAAQRGKSHDHGVTDHDNVLYTIQDCSGRPARMDQNR
jgi:hypothetical protein